MSDDILDYGLMDDMLNYSPIKFTSPKAERAFWKCIDNKHWKLARKIYSRYAQVRSDLAMSFTMLLHATKNKK